MLPWMNIMITWMNIGSQMLPLEKSVLGLISMKGVVFQPTHEVQKGCLTCPQNNVVNARCSVTLVPLLVLPPAPYSKFQHS